MSDVREGYAACKSGGDIYVLDPANKRVCSIPLLESPWTPNARNDEERWSIASNLARLLNEESARCHRAGLPIEDLRTAARKVEGLSNA